MALAELELKKRLNDVFREVFDDEAIEIFDQMTANNIEQWDSLKHITLVVAIENEFGFQFTASEIGNLENVSQLMRIIKERAK